MTSKPILFSAEMVVAILDGRKTMTRRIVKPQSHALQWPGCGCKCPYGEPGTRLWVREEHYRFGHWEPVPGVKTKSGRMKWRFIEDSPELRFDAPDSFRKGRHHKDPETPAWHKRLARFMFRKHSRIERFVSTIRVERLQDISEEDAISEGIELISGEMNPRDFTGCWRDYTGSRPYWNSPRDSFHSLWESINGPDSWDRNPFLWVIEFKRVEESSL